MLKKQAPAFIVIALLTLVYCFIESYGEGDLYIYLQGALVLDQGGNIYTEKFIHGQYHYYYSVIFAYLLIPFYTLPFFGVKFCWLVLNAFLYWHLFYLLMNSAMVKSLPEKRAKLFLILLFIFSLRFLHENIHTSQITILIFWCCVFGLYLIETERPGWGSLILALGINIKLLPLVFLPYLLYRKRYKALFFAVDWLLILAFLPSILIGHNYNKVLLESWWDLVNPSNPQHVLDVAERSFHGLSTLLATLLVAEVPDKFALDIRRNIMNIDIDTLHQVLTIVRLVLIGLVVFIIKDLPFRVARTSWQKCLEVSYILLLIPLIFPHQQHYAFLFAVPAYGMVLYEIIAHGIKHPFRKPAAWLLTVVYLLCNSKLILGEFNHYYEHYKILTYGALVLVAMMLWVRRRNEEATILNN